MKRLLVKLVASITLMLLVAQTSCTPAQQQQTVQTAQAVAQAAAQAAQAASDVAQVLALFRGLNVAGAPASLTNTAGIAGKEGSI